MFIIVLCNLYLFDTGCNNAGFYGRNCDSACPTNCKDSTCQIQNGTCFSCKPGWTGLDCDTSKMINLIFDDFKCYGLFMIHISNSVICNHFIKAPV